MEYFAQAAWSLRRSKRKRDPAPATIGSVMSNTADIPEHPHSGGSLFPLVGNWIADLGALVTDFVTELGSIAQFGLRTLGWLLTRLPKKETIFPNFYQIGVLSLPVVALTGTFIGMVLAVQSYGQFRMLHMESRLGAVINMSLVRELGPVLAATMLAGRVGSAMAAELGTMRVTEQIDALASMGANPIHYLVVPRFLACLVLDPRLDDHGRLHGHRRRGLLQRLLCWASTGITTGPIRSVTSAVSTFSPACSRACSSARPLP